MSQIDHGAHTLRPWSTLLPAHPKTDVWPTNSLPPTVLGCTQTRSDLEAAELLWVDVDTLRTRLAFLDDIERARVGLTRGLAC